MTDEELIVRLRNLSANMFQSGSWGKDLDTTKAAADRIEQLLEELYACTGGTGGCGYWREATKKRDEQIENLRLLIDELTKTCERLLEERKSLINAVSILS